LEKIISPPFIAGSVGWLAKPISAGRLNNDAFDGTNYMHGDFQTNALAEIGLALAMALFSIMILTLVSMGAGNAPSKSAQAAADVVSLRASHAKKSPTQPAAKTKTTSRDSIIIYYGSRYYDSELKPINVESLAGKEEVVLAVDPKLSVTDAVRAQKYIAAMKLVVTTLDENWLKVLKEKIK
jgi:hypothetical protein